MSDALLRALERKWRETGAPDDGAAYLVGLERAGATFIDALAITRGKAPKLMRQFPGSTPTYEASRDPLIESFMHLAEGAVLPQENVIFEYCVPLLLTAYRTLGRDHDACRVEEQYENLGDRRYNMGALDDFRTTLKPRAHREDYDDIRRHAREGNIEAAMKLVIPSYFDQQTSALGVIAAEVTKREGVTNGSRHMNGTAWSDYRPDASLIWVDDLLQEGRIDDALAVCRLPSGRHSYVGYRVARHLAQEGRITRAGEILAPGEDGQAPRGNLACAVYCMLATTLNGKCFDEE